MVAHISCLAKDVGNLVHVSTGTAVPLSLRNKSHKGSPEVNFSDSQKKAK